MEKKGHNSQASKEEKRNNKITTKKTRKRSIVKVEQTSNEMKADLNSVYLLHCGTLSREGDISGKV